MANIWWCCHLRIKCLPANLLAALMWRWYMNSEGATFQLRMEDSGESEGDDKKEKGHWMPSPHVGEGKREKKIYKARKDRRKRGIGNRWREKRKEKNHIFRACPKGIEEEIPSSYLSPFFTLKPNILAQDQTLSCTLQIHCLGYVGLDPLLFWIQVNSGPYNWRRLWGTAWSDQKEIWV